MSLRGILKEMVKSKKWYLEKKQNEKLKSHEMKDEGNETFVTENMNWYKKLLES